VTSVTFVDGVKATAALPFSCVTVAVFPDTEAISPLTRAWPVEGGDVADVAGAAAELVVLGDVVGPDLFDEPHAATDTAVTPASASIANWLSRDV
jgi:hypothetical protein